MLQYSDSLGLLQVCGEGWHTILKPAIRIDSGCNALNYSPDVPRGLLGAHRMKRT